MNNVKFSLADALGLAIAFVFGFVCFLSFNFSSLGDIHKSIGYAIALGLIIWILSYLLKRLKAASGSFRTAKIFEIIVLLLFLIVAFFSIKPFSHFFTVTSHKSEIISKTNENIDQLEKMFPAYEAYARERIDMYKRHLNTAINGKAANHSQYLGMGFNPDSGEEDKAQQKRFVEILESDLLPSAYTATKESAINWLAETRIKVDSWNPRNLISIVNNINTLSEQGDAWKIQLQGYSNTNREGEESAAFNYSTSFNEVTSYFQKQESPSVLAIILAIIAYLGMLFSWLITPKHSRNNIPVRELLFRNSRTKDEGEL